MLSKNVKSIGLILLLLALFLVPIYTVRAESHLIITNILPESINVNAGSSIFIQLVIYNNDSVSPHNFTIYWIAEGIDTFSSRGIIMPNETKSLTPSFTFSNYGSHELNIVLYEDDILVETRTVTINSQNFSMSLNYFSNYSAIYPGDNFSLTATVINDGEKTVYNPLFRLFPTELYNSGILLMSMSTLFLDNLTKGRSQEVMLDFRTSPNTPQGIYSLRVQLDYYDYDYSYQRYQKYQKSYTIPIVIQSNQVLDELEQIHYDYNTLKGMVTKLQGTLQSMLYVIIAVLVISVLMAGINYYHAKHVYEQHRKKLREKK